MCGSRWWVLQLWSSQTALTEVWGHCVYCTGCTYIIHFNDTNFIHPPVGESSTQVSPFLPGGVSDGNWHTVHIHYYNKVGLQLNPHVPYTHFHFALLMSICGGVFLYIILQFVYFTCFYLCFCCTGRTASCLQSTLNWAELFVRVQLCGRLHVIVFIHAYSPHISFNFLHVLSFSSACYTLCEYECVSVHMHLLFSELLFIHPSSFQQQTVTEEWMCLPFLLSVCALAHKQCLLFLPICPTNKNFPFFLPCFMCSNSTNTNLM